MAWTRTWQLSVIPWPIQRHPGVFPILELEEIVCCDKWPWLPLEDRSGKESNFPSLLLSIAAWWPKTHVLKAEIFLSFFKEGRSPFLATCPPPSATPSLPPPPATHTLQSQAYSFDRYRKRIHGLGERARTTVQSYTLNKTIDIFILLLVLLKLERAFSNQNAVCQLTQWKLTRFKDNPFILLNGSGVFESTYLSTNPFISALI